MTRPAGLAERSTSHRPRMVVGAILAVVAITFSPVVPAHADSIRDAEYWLSEYGFNEAWDTTRGGGVTVAVIDTGVDGSVRELRGAVVGGADFSGLGSPDGQTPVGSDSEHGTMVASVLAGRGTGLGDGVIGVAPEASLLSASIELGSSKVDADQQIADAVRWAVDQGADVINLSLTRNSLAWPYSWDEAFQYAFDHDVVLIAAAGNRGDGTAEAGAPATIPGVVAVSGVDVDGVASDDSSTQGITVAVAAPSEELVGVIPGGSYVIWSGTSGAAPIVSGLAALIRSAHPELDANGVIERLIRTATPAGEPVPNPQYGYGRINAAAALSSTLPAPAVNPLGSLAEWVQTYRPQGARESISAPAPEVTERTIEPPVSLPGPSVLAITGWIVPSAVILGFAGLITLLVLAAVAYFRRVARR